MELAKETYAPAFVDHVNATELHGHEGIRRSTGLYRALFDDLAIRVVDQVSQADRVASRWVDDGVESRAARRSRDHDQPAATTAASSRTGRRSTASSCYASSA